MVRSCKLLCPSPLLMGPGMLKSSSSPGPWKSRTHEEEISYPFTYSKAFIVLRCGEEKILCLQSCVFGMELLTLPLARCCLQYLHAAAWVRGERLMGTCSVMHVGVAGRSPVAFSTRAANMVPNSSHRPVPSASLALDPRWCSSACRYHIRYVSCQPTEAIPGQGLPDCSVWHHVLTGEEGCPQHHTATGEQKASARHPTKLLTDNLWEVSPSAVIHR